ncbi:MAG: 4a-hydroxytetrahydrobiopterin dehydratase [Proteobacteria bacterium ST_bin13]|jgi:4a-hydroxytetrahydrobiopterin dehydratase|nr:MAG: 4a-hydroxytetrahydrobiopterin dehydratase [Proteobacteria bacterium ST_bin13]
MMIAPLSESERAAALAALPLWAYDEARGALYRRISLGTFSRVFGLMACIAIEAEKRDHHPEWANVYDTLDIWLTTHDAGGVSTRDVQMAGLIDHLAVR